MQTHYIKHFCYEKDIHKTSPSCNRGQSHPHPGTTRARLQIESDSTADKSNARSCEQCCISGNNIYPRQHHTIQDLPKTGRPPILDDRTKRRLARMTLRGDVASATELAKSAADHDIAHVSAGAIRNVLHDEGLKAMHIIRKPLLTRTHKRKRLDFALTHRDWTVQQWKQVIFSDETPILARPSETHKLRWVKPTHGLNPKLVVPTVQGGGAAIMVWGCISTYGFHDLVLLDGAVDAKGYVTVLQHYLLPVIEQYIDNHTRIFQQDNVAVHTAHEVLAFF
ncbi:MAG: hypothetical protein EON98_12790 [Chitinophagaceae bacterium]|nr:MAG: hypothetical protein EON98_12790 [Chitinophagaceae bacterium]